VDHVYTMERIWPLQKKAKNHLWDLKLKNVSYQHNDGILGWPEQAPFDGILVSAAPSEIPETLLRQMALGGIMIIPVGKSGNQTLQRVVRTQGGFEVEELEPVSFVPFLSGREL
jgi:protein-L-isoaspartate(D-aspartate) O-methyltransferase